MDRQQAYNEQVEAALAHLSEAFAAFEAAAAFAQDDESLGLARMLRDKAAALAEEAVRGIEEGGQ